MHKQTGRKKKNDSQQFPFAGALKFNAPCRNNNAETKDLCSNTRSNLLAFSFEKNGTKNSLNNALNAESSLKLLYSVTCH